MKPYPLARYSEEPVTDYPLTKDELRVLALFWEEEALEARVFCCVFGTVGTTDLRLWACAKDRIDRITAILGNAEMRKVQAEAEERVRERRGEEIWTAFLEGRPICREQ